MARLLKVSPSSSPPEEREGLLSNVDSFSIIEAKELKQSSPSDTIKSLSFGLTRIAFVVGAVLGFGFGLLCWFSAPHSHIRDLHFNGETLRSNGTHDFKRTVLLVSIDGLRDAPF